MRHVIMILSTMVLGVGAPINDAYAKVALAQVRINVVDQDGIVVPDAKIWGGFTCGSRMNDYVLVDGMTNTNGEFVAQGKCNEFLRVDVTKEGYYQSEIKVNFLRSKADPRVVDGKWQPYGETRTVVMKRIRNPGRCVIPKQGGQFAWNIPVFGEWIGFDFEEFDWTSPYGRGKCEDVLLKFQGKCNKRFVDYEYEMEVCFTNQLYAGAYVCDLAGYSDLKTQYCADTNGEFQTSFRFVLKKSSTQRVMECVGQNQYLVFRTRTKVDDGGKLKAAHYGSLQGMWSFGDKQMSVGDACFNIYENDTNIEDGRTLRDKIKNYAKRK